MNTDEQAAADEGMVDVEALSLVGDLIATAVCFWTVKNVA